MLDGYRVFFFHKWLSRGRVVERFSDLSNEFEVFFKAQNKPKFKEFLKAFMKKLENRIRKAKMNNAAIFEKLSVVLDAGRDGELLPETQKIEILDHGPCSIGKRIK
ncbi:unnamed protein product, partial [Anisakis simplex]|uniref:Uncharacterized protein n=1 Tax=Anisakis simplex TaxID=6269 RepID=A0A0M3JZL8_ANISI